MATDSWKDGSDNWTTAADWSTGAPPAATDTADIETGNPQITSNVGTIGSLFLDNASLSIEGGALGVLQGVYNVAGTIGIDDNAAGTPLSGGSVVAIAGTLTNTGAVVIGNSNLTTSTSVQAGAISNNGSVTVVGAAPSNLLHGQASLSVAGAAGFGTVGAVEGSVSVLNNAQISFGSGSLTTINGSLDLEGSEASINIAGAPDQNSALSNLSQISPGGSLKLDAASFSTSATDFGNEAGHVEIAGGAVFSVAGSFHNSFASLSIVGSTLKCSNLIQNGGAVDMDGGTITTSCYTQDSNPSFLNFYPASKPSVIQINGGNSNFLGSINSMGGTGIIDFEGGTATLSAEIHGTANVQLGENAYVDFVSPDTSPTSAITFKSGSAAVLRFDYVYQDVVQNPIVGFAPGDTIDLRRLAYSPDATVNYNASNNTLTVSSNGMTDTLSLALPQVTDFRVESDGFGGTQIVCFRAGTRIRTVSGDRTVESLAIGDRVVTASGDIRPIQWVGHRTIDCRHPNPQDAKPIRIARNAFAGNLPERDLFVSPSHAICVDVAGGVLIPASALVNGTTIVQAEVETVTYWHVELASHDILLAEGLPTESYIDTGNRDFFVERAGVALDAAPDAVAARHAAFCRPFYPAGPLVEVARRRLAARAMQTSTSDEAEPPRYATSKSVANPLARHASNSARRSAIAFSSVSIAKAPSVT